MVLWLLIQSSLVGEATYGITIMKTTAVCHITQTQNVLLADRMEII